MRRAAELLGQRNIIHASCEAPRASGFRGAKAQMNKCRSKSKRNTRATTERGRLA